MPLFKSSNKSQASLNRIVQNTGNNTPEANYPGFGGSHPADRFSESSPDDNITYSQNQILTHPAHILGRSHSSRAPAASSGVDPYAQRRPSVNIASPIAPPNTIQEESPIPGQTQFGRSVRVERNEVNTREQQQQKKSKRGIFGLSSKDKDKYKESSPTEQKTIGRSGSILQRSQSPAPGLRVVQPEAGQAQYSVAQDSSHQPVYRVQQGSSVDNSPEDPSHYNQFQRTQRPQSEYDTLKNLLTSQSPDYEEDAPRFSPREDRHQPYQQSESANNSDTFIPIQTGQQIDQPLSARPSTATRDFDPYGHLRPPSQASLGPPSPIASQPPTFQHDSRPSTSTNQSRLSSQSALTSQQATMPPPERNANGSLRQQLAQQRDLREENNPYPASAPQEGRVRGAAAPPDQGRSTPPPRSREDITKLDYDQLLQRHEELQSKYSKVKRYYFEREAQVTQLQNTVANQRLSMSRTSLDDAQYTTRFDRLNGAIQNLAFNIRKDWRHIPPWLGHVCNRDAHTTGTKEMTAIGRACISRWLFETFFQACFHPALHPDLSVSLKNIENNLRRSGNILMTDEQRDDLTTKITTWRLTTVEGLQPLLSSPQAEQFQDTLTRNLTQNLTAALQSNLNEPPPPGLTEGVLSLVSQAVGIAANLPLESRDVCMSYYMPNTVINETFMKLESNMTPLTTPGQDERVLLQQQMHQAESRDQDQTSTTSDQPSDKNVEDSIRESAAKASSAGIGLQQSHNGRNDSISGKSNKDKKSSFLGGFSGGFVGSSGSKKPTPSARPGASSENILQNNSGTSIAPNAAEADEPATSANPGSREGTIRFAAFLAVEVRSKTIATAKDSGSVPPEGESASVGTTKNKGAIVLVKAPVYAY